MNSGVYEKVETFKTERMRSPVFNVFISGQKYGGGFKNPVKDIPNGSPVLFESKTNERGYLELVSIQVAPGAVVQTASQTSITPPSQTLPSQTHLIGTGTDYTKIDRRDMVGDAIEVVKAFYSHPHGPKKVPSLAELVFKVVTVADHFVAYIQTGTVEPLSPEEIARMKEIKDAATEPVEEGK